MAVTPWYVGATHIPLSVTFNDDSGNAVNLTGATVTVRMSLAGAAGAAGSGTVVIVNAAAGTFTYQFSSADIATAGTYGVQFVATYGDGSVVLSDVLQIQVLAAI